MTATLQIRIDTKTWYTFCMNYHKGFIVPLLTIIIAILVVGGGVYVYTQTKPANKPVPVVVSQTTQTTSTAQSSSSQSTEKLFTPFIAWVGLTLRLPARAEIKDNFVNIDNSEFRFGGGAAGLCPPTSGSEVGGSTGYSNGINCTYEDDKTLNNITVLRLWKDSRGVFALNPQGVPVTDPTSYFIISKTKPNQIFTTSEITFWKEIISKIK